MDGNVIALEELRSIISRLAALYHFKDVRLFGSYARGEATENSDIDVMITYDAGSRALDALSFGERLSEETGKHVDSFERGEINHGPLLDAIAREGLVMYSC